MNIVDHVFPSSGSGRLARRAHPALIAGEETVTYGRLEFAVQLAAERLMSAGFPMRRPGRVPRVGLLCPNGIAHVVLALAILRNGGCLVPIAAELTALERDAVVRTVGLDALIISDRTPWPQVTVGSPEVPRYRIESLGATLLPQLPEAWRVPLSGAAHDFCEADLAAVNPAFIRFSSGTTGAAKGVVLSHEALLARLETANRLLAIGPEDRILWILSMAHHFAVSIMLYLVRGATTLIAESAMAEPLLDTALAQEATLLYGAPFHYALLSAEASGRQWPSLRLAISTAAALPERTARAFHQRFGLPPVQGLGMIEAGLPLLNLTAAAEKPTAVGRPAPGGIEATVHHPDTGALLPAGETGELWLRGPGFFDAYLSPWQPRATVLTPEGWLRTGDLAMVDREGILRLQGRLKTVINVGGMKCFPEEIESALETHPGVREARVFGREHVRFGSVPVAEIVPTCDEPPPVSQLVAHLRELLAAYKIPVEFHFVHALPRTPSGKIARMAPAVSRP